MNGPKEAEWPVTVAGRHRRDRLDRRGGISRGLDALPTNLYTAVDVPNRQGHSCWAHSRPISARASYACGSASSAPGDGAHKFSDQFSAHLTEAAGAGALLTGRTADADHVRTSRPKAGQFLQAERGQEPFTALDAGRPDLARKGS